MTLEDFRKLAQELKKMKEIKEKIQAIGQASVLEMNGSTWFLWAGDEYKSTKSDSYVDLKNGTRINLRTGEVSVG